MDNRECYKLIDFHNREILNFNNIILIFYNIFYDDMGEKRDNIINYCKENGKENLIQKIIEHNENEYYIMDNLEKIIINNTYIDIVLKYIYDVYKILEYNSFNEDGGKHIKMFIYNSEEFKTIIHKEFEYIKTNNYNTKNLLIVRGGGDRIDQNIPDFARKNDFFIILIESCSGWGCPDERLCNLFSEEGISNKILHLKGTLNFSHILLWNLFDYFNNPIKKHIIIDTVSYLTGITEYILFKNIIKDKFYDANTHYFYSTGAGIYFYNQYDIKRGSINNYITELNYKGLGKCDNNDNYHCPLNSITFNELYDLNNELLDKFTPVIRYKLNCEKFSGYFSKYLKYKNKYIQLKKNFNLY